MYVASGLSYEAGLPRICDMHECFGVDSETSVGFASGKDDPLPKLLATEAIDRVKKFCGLHVQALEAAQPGGKEYRRFAAKSFHRRDFYG